MGSFSAVTRNKMLTDFLTDATNYIALYNGDPEGAGTEITGAGYVRVATVAGEWGTPTAGSVSNTTAISFPEATGDWNSGTAITYFAIFSTLTVGTLLGSGNVAVPKSVLTGDTASFAIGSLTLSLT